ncbi:MAG TPA: DUF499 domain-containing protein [Acidobacteriota bacterium]|nr:DUF499 domain-containing protein [Acidobacteriota bacterium]
MEPWYKVATPRKEVREGRSFNPDEFAIHLEQVVAGTAPEDYRDARQFFGRTCFTRALREHAGMVLRRLAGQTANTAPVLTLITQFGGGKTHTLTALYHLATNGPSAKQFPGISDRIIEWELPAVPQARVAVFVGNAWDPQPGRETPWIDIARQLAGEAGVRELGPAAATTPPGTEALGRIFAAANGPVLLLFDEVLNFFNRHRAFADPFHAFIQNLTVAMTGTPCGVAMISLPRSQVEMTDWDMQWQDRLTKVVRRVAKDLIANDETEISEVVRKRLFEDLGSERIRRNVATTYATWCFDRRAQLPPEWTAVDSAATQAGAAEFLRGRFENCYPFHPATLSVFQRKWQALAQYQQTRGTLAMLAQWIAWAYRTGFTEARREPLITLGSAPLEAPEFRSVVLGQLGESRLVAAIDADIASDHAHARALDADTKGPLRQIHRRVGTAVFFESSGGQVDKVAHLPELRFALGEPDVDTTSIDTAAFALEDKSYFFRRVGADGFKISHQPTLKKVVSDRRASIDEATEILPAMRQIVKKEFERGTALTMVSFPDDGAAVADTPRLTIVVMDPESEWVSSGALRTRIAEWTRQRGKSPRLYPGALVWCLKKPGRELRDKVELWLAWKRVAKEIAEGTLGGEFEKSERAEIQAKLTDAEEAAKDEVWGGFRYAVLFDSKETDGLRVIDLGAGHSSGSETMCGRVITALMSEGLLSKSVGAAYLERAWPPALKASGAWPLASLRQSFLNGSLIRLTDPDAVLREKIAEFVTSGTFGLASNPQADGSYTYVWFQEQVHLDEIAFDSNVFLLTKAQAKAIKEGRPGSAAGSDSGPTPGKGAGTGSASGMGSGILPGSATGAAAGSTPGSATGTQPGAEAGGQAGPASTAQTRRYRISGCISPEKWNRLGTKIIPKLKQGSDVEVGAYFDVTLDAASEAAFITDIKQILSDIQNDLDIQVLEDDK